MRIVAGSLRGRTLEAPPGDATRPTADRVRQALFDMLAHAPWADDALQGNVLDGFAGSGALGLEALSRGAARVLLLDRDRVALDCIRRNVASLGAGNRTLVLAGDATRPPRVSSGWVPAGLVFLDPPYRAGLVAPALAALIQQGWARPDAMVVAEIAVDEATPTAETLLADRRHGAARLCIWRAGQGLPSPATAPIRSEPPSPADRRDRSGRRRNGP